MSVKGIEAGQILPIIIFLCYSCFPVLLFSPFSSLGKRYQITEVRSQDPALIPVLLTDLTFSAFAWTCRTWTILWIERMPAPTVSRYSPLCMNGNYCIFRCSRKDIQGFLRPRKACKIRALQSTRCRYTA